MIYSIGFFHKRGSLDEMKQSYCKELMIRYFIAIKNIIEVMYKGGVKNFRMISGVMPEDFMALQGLISMDEYIEKVRKENNEYLKDINLALLAFIPSQEEIDSLPDDRAKSLILAYKEMSSEKIKLNHYEEKKEYLIDKSNMLFIYYDINSENEEYEEFIAVAKAKGKKVFNLFTGKRM